MTRTARLLSLAAAAALAIAACGGSVSTTAPSDAPAVSVAPASVAPLASEAPPGEAPASSAVEGPDIDAAAAALDDIDKYAVDIKVSGLMEAAADASEITMSGTVDREAGSYQFDMAGVAGLEAVGGGSAISFVVIGDDAWISTGDGNFIKTPGGAAMFGSLEQSLARGAARLDPDELAPEPAGRRPGGEERRRHDPLPRDGCGLVPGCIGSRARLRDGRVDRR